MSNDGAPAVLPVEWVEKIFERCSLLYGRRFLLQWEDQEAEAVKLLWASELAGFANWPRAIGYALQNLPPDNPPNVLQFKALARRCPAEDMAPRLDYPVASKETRTAAVAGLSPAERPPNREWARRIVARKKAGEHIAPLVVRIAEDALYLEARMPHGDGAL